MQIISKEEHRILLNGRIDSIRDKLKSIPRWRNRLYLKDEQYRSREFHLQNVLRNLSTNEDLTTLLEEIVDEYQKQEIMDGIRKEGVFKRIKIKL